MDKNRLSESEHLVEVTAELSEALNLHFYSTATAKKVRNKYLMRLALKEKGLKVPNFMEILDHDALNAVESQIAFPAVLKPINGYSSINVKRIDSINQLSDTLKTSNKKNSSDGWGMGIENSYIIEEYIDGLEYSVESVVFNDKIIHLGVTSKFKNKEPYFEEIGQLVPAKIDEQLKQGLYNIAEQGIKALNLTNCATHTEILNSSQGLVIVEIGGRLAGDKIPYLVNLSSGIDMSLLTAYAAIKNPCPVINQVKNKVSYIAYFVPDKKQTIEKVVNQAPEIKNLIEFEFWGEVGQTIAPPPEQYFCRIGHAIVVGDGYEECNKRIREVIKWISDETGISLEDVSFLKNN
ncbi:MAG: ATP-grasp domain-containing protein [Defluviitaleaceae bacterium]|nr:ATP-grasp domain-containing protein [Defluviitaleaceae bacterium]